MQNQEYENWLYSSAVQKKLEPVKKLQDVLLQMLVVIDKVCNDNGLQYSLFYGTLLGAIRHEGFIPWDDDADIVMPRDDYEKLLKLPKSAWPEGYFLQSPYSEKGSRFAFAKLRKDGTTCLCEDHAHIKMHHGIFVDIFPLDRTTSRKKWLLWKIPRVFERATAFSCARLPTSMCWLKPLQKVWMRIFSPSFFSRVANVIARNISGKGGVFLDTFQPDRSNVVAKGYTASLIFPVYRRAFEGNDLCVPCQAEELLESIYGNWKVIPSEEKRIPIHSKGGVIDTERDYSCYKKNREV